jgi:hypothetical protein
LELEVEASLAGVSRSAGGGIGLASGIGAGTGLAGSNTALRAVVSGRTLPGPTPVSGRNLRLAPKSAKASRCDSSADIAAGFS